MKTTWLGKSSLIFNTGDTVIAINPFNTGVKADLVIVTDVHAQHFAKDTVEAMANDGATVLTAPCAAEDHVSFPPHSVWSVNNVTVYSVRATSGIGIIIDDGERTYYVAGKTLYNFEVIDDVLDLVEDGVDFAFLPINGKGGNMHARDAADFAYEIGAKAAVPVCYCEHCATDPEDFDFEDAIILEKGVETEI